MAPARFRLCLVPGLLVFPLTTAQAITMPGIGRAEQPAMYLNQHGVILWTSWRFEVSDVSVEMLTEAADL